jgi:hypothetical protein
MPEQFIQQREDSRLSWLKRWIWIYFWLLIFEGALRKWVFPQLSGPLLIIRDPIVLVIYVQAYRCRLFSIKKMWPFAFLTIGLTLLAIAQVTAGVNSIWIALYGMRSYLLHLPLALIMAETLTGEDVRRFGRWMLILSVPMTALLVAQYYAPVGSWLNFGAGESSRQISSAGGHIRPAGTFSFVVGSQSLAVLTAAFVVYALMRRGMYPRWILWPAMLATIISIPVLSSRTAAFQIATMAGFALLAGISSSAQFANLLKVTGILLLVSVAASQLPFVDDAINTFSQRWTEASMVEGDTQGVLDKRVLDVVVSGFEAAASTPMLGNGIGMGSNFAAYLKVGSTSFLLAEMEWERVVLEFGPLFGLVFMGLRVLVSFYLVSRALRAMRRNNTLPWLLVPAVVPLVVLTIMEQPTFTGFMVFGSGLCLASAAATAKTPPRRPAWMQRATAGAL